MVLSLTPVDASGRDRDELIAFLTTQEFPFHVRRRPTTAQVAADIGDGAWAGDEVESFWLDDGEDRVGVVRLHDLRDPTAMIDLRLAEHRRGRGFGAQALPLAADHVFRTRDDVVRLEGHTREDNAAMRRTFEKCGWVREAWFRDGWPVEGGEPMASLAYSVIRRDWTTGTATAVPREPDLTPSCESPLTDRRVRNAATLAADAWAAEERLLDPAVRADAEQLRGLLADDFVEIGQSGRLWTRDEIISALIAESHDLEPAAVEERASRPIGPDTVLLTYLLRIDGRSSRRSAVWRCDPRPRCVFHQGTRVPE